MIIKDEAKTILCFGDSNTWGANPEDGSRYPRSVRWTGVLQKLLGEDHEVISEGLCARTFVAHDPAKPHRTGITHLRAILESCDPLDLVIIMLGTNDIKETYRLGAAEIAGHLEQVIKVIQDKKIGLIKVPKILVICPPPPVVPEDGKTDPRIVRASEIFKALPDLYEKVSKKHACYFLNAANYISSSKVDGYHLDPESHLKLAATLRDTIQKIGI